MKEIIRSVLDAELTGQAYAVRESPRAPLGSSQEVYRLRVFRYNDLVQVPTNQTIEVMITMQKLPLRA